MIPDELLSLLTSLEFEEDGGVVLQSVESRDESLRVFLEIRIRQETELRQWWAVECVGVRQESFRFTWADALIEEVDHPLLWPYLDTHGALHFSALDTHPAKLIGDLYLAQKAIAGNHFPLERFINGHLLTGEFGEASSGLLAEGPMPILQCFSRVLAAHGAKCSIIKEREPARWTGSEFIPETMGVRLLQIGDSFVIAEDFEFRRRKRPDTVPGSSTISDFGEHDR